MERFLISAAATEELSSAVERLGGKLIHPNLWIANWEGAADSLCHYLRRGCRSGVVVCSVNGDWSYR